MSSSSSSDDGGSGGGGGGGDGGARQIDILLNRRASHPSLPACLPCLPVRAY